MKNEGENLKRFIIRLMWLVFHIIFGVEYGVLCRNKFFNFCLQIWCCQNGKFKFLYISIDFTFIWKHLLLTLIWKILFKSWNLKAEFCNCSNGDLGSSESRDHKVNGTELQRVSGMPGCGGRMKVFEKGFICLVFSGIKCIRTRNGTIWRLRCLTGWVHLKRNRAGRSQ